MKNIKKRMKYYYDYTHQIQVDNDIGLVMDEMHRNIKEGNLLVKTNNLERLKRPYGFENVDNFVTVSFFFKDIWKMR